MVYRCSICGYVFDEKEQGKSFSELTECPVCKQPVTKFELVSSGEKTESRERTAVGEKTESGEKTADGEKAESGERQQPGR